MTTSLKPLRVSLSLNVLVVLLVGAVLVRLGPREAWERSLRVFSSEPVTVNQITASNYRELPLPTGSVVLIGDSLTEFGPWEEMLPGVFNRGISGDTIARVRARVGEIMASHPSKVFLMIGINDLHLSGDVLVLVSAYGNLLEQMRAASPQSSVFIETVLPVDETRCRNSSNARILAFNAGIIEQAVAHGCQVVDTFAALVGSDGNLRADCCVSDGKHISGHGYRLWSHALETYVNQK